MKLIIDNQLIEYKDEGSDRVVLLLHGWGTDLTTFNQLALHLSKKFRVIRFDFPGFGQSPKPSNDWSVVDYAKLTKEIIEKLKINQIYAIIGHSFGGRVAIKAASFGFIKTEKLILIGSAGVKPSNSLKKNMYKSVAKIGKFVSSAPLINKMQPALRKKLYKTAGSTDYIEANQMQKIFLNVINEDLLSDVSKIIQSTLLIWGENDNETPVSDAKKMMKLLKSGKLVVIPKSGHFVYIDSFDKVNDEIGKFLS